MFFFVFFFFSGGIRLNELSVFNLRACLLIAHFCVAIGCAARKSVAVASEVVL